MNERLKRILLLCLFTVVVLVLGYAIYRVFFLQAPLVPTQTPPITKPTGTLPIAGQGTTTPNQPGGGTPGLPTATSVPATIPGTAAAPSPSRTTVLSQEVVNALSLSPRGGVRAYNPQDGKFYHITDAGQIVAMSDQVFSNVDQVTWGHQTDQAILSYPDGSKILYDFSQKKQVTLPKHWEDFQFSPQDQQIAAKSLGSDASNRFLVTANTDGTNAQLVEELGNNQDRAHVSWSPSDQVIAYSFTGSPTGFDSQEVLLVGKNHENFKGLMVEGRGFVPNWSPNGQNILYSVYQSNTGFRPTLWVSGALGDSINASRTNLEINTWADKCAWQDTASLICAVPDTLPTGAGLQRSVADGIPDSIYRIDLRTGLKINLGQPDGKPTIDQIVVAPDGRSAYLRDQSTGKLLRFAL